MRGRLRDHRPKAKAPVITFFQRSRFRGIVFDKSIRYPKKARSWTDEKYTLRRLEFQRPDLLNRGSINSSIPVFQKEGIRF